MQIKSSEPDLETLFNRINRGAIDLQPDFQRDLVWNKAKKQGLIDTIIREWRFPPIFVVAPKVGGVLEVLDGQQRLNAILEFYNGNFPLDGFIEPSDSLVSGLDGMYYSDLPNDVLQKINGYPVQFFELYDYKEDEPYELFFRLNQGSNLTPAEKRNTLYGPVRSQVRELVSWMDECEIGIDKIGFNSSRLSYHDVITRLIFLLDKGSIKRKVTDKSLVEFFRDGIPVTDSSFNRAKKSIVRLSRMIGKKIKLNKSTLLTWFLFLSLDDADSNFIYEFESKRLNLRANYDSTDPLDFLLSIYQEKSSSSVNDAIPVQLRLLVVQMTALMLGVELNSDIGNKAKLILDIFLLKGDFSEPALTELMLSEGWSFK